MVIEPFHTWPKTIKPAPEPKPGPTQEQLNRWTASYAAADAGSLGAPPAAAQRTADAARTQGTRPANSVSPSTVTDTQTRLTTLGYDTGGVDGIAGQKTDQAIRDFQAANGLTVDGRLLVPRHEAALADCQIQLPRTSVFRHTEFDDRGYTLLQAGRGKPANESGATFRSSRHKLAKGVSDSLRQTNQRIT